MKNISKKFFINYFEIKIKNIKLMQNDRLNNINYKYFNLNNFFINIFEKKYFGKFM